MINTGFSIYFSSGLDKNISIIEKANKYGVKFAFTSLHIPEDQGIDYSNDIKTILSQCASAGICLICDVAPDTLDKLCLSSMRELHDLGVEYIRLDFGYDAQETVELSKLFHIVFNASTIYEDEINEWKRAGADFSRFLACHNYYPKTYTALSINKVRQINDRLKVHGFKVASFVPGSECRGPLMEGLPTVEAHRSRSEDVVYNALELIDAGSDIVLIGDIDITDDNWEKLGELSDGYVSLRSEVHKDYKFIRDTVHHDRPDASDYVFRSQESRSFKRDIPCFNTVDSVRGDIRISNTLHKRYMGELEVARVNLNSDNRVNVIGSILEEDRKYLDYIKDGIGIKFI